MQLQVQFETGQEDRVSDMFGPYDFVQLTYEDLRVGPDGEVVLAQQAHGVWHTNDGQWWSDVIIMPTGVST